MFVGFLCSLLFGARLNGEDTGVLGLGVFRLLGIRL